MAEALIDPKQAAPRPQVDQQQAAREAANRSALGRTGSTQAQRQGLDPSYTPGYGASASQNRPMGLTPEADWRGMFGPGLNASRAGGQISAYARPMTVSAMEAAINKPLSQDERVAAGVPQPGMGANIHNPWVDGIVTRALHPQPAANPFSMVPPGTQPSNPAQPHPSLSVNAHQEPHPDDGLTPGTQEEHAPISGEKPVAPYAASNIWTGKPLRHPMPGRFNRFMESSYEGMKDAGKDFIFPHRIIATANP
jgi:hypothetical protein